MFFLTNVIPRMFCPACLAGHLHPPAARQALTCNLVPICWVAGGGDQSARLGRGCGGEGRAGGQSHHPHAWLLPKAPAGAAVSGEQDGGT